ncbi:MAG: hypothetical protein AAF486_04565 [Pseudomonadota bacterium]
MRAGAEDMQDWAALLTGARASALGEDAARFRPLSPLAAGGADALPGALIVIDFKAEGAAALLEAYAEHKPKCRVILVGQDLPASAIRNLFRFDASDVLDASADGPALLQACRALADQARAAAPSQAAQCWALRGAVGGAGVTTLAIETAFATLRQQPSWRVCLIDLNLTDGMAAAFLDVEKKLDVNALGGPSERIDASLLGAYALEHPKGIFIMAAQRNPLAEQVARSEGVLAFLDVACTMFDHVIVDMPRHQAPWTDAVLAAVDEVLVVSELTVPSLHAAGDLCREIDAVRGGRPARLMLNRMFAKRSHRHSFPLEKAERAIHRTVDYSIRSDWDHARMAVNLGMPVAQVKPKSPLVKDVSDTVDDLLGGLHLSRAA